jgi:hypothetical protein
MKPEALTEIITPLTLRTTLLPKAHAELIDFSALLRCEPGRR